MDEFVKVEKKGPYDKNGERLPIGAVVRLADVKDGKAMLASGFLSPYKVDAKPVRPNRQN